MTVRIGLLAASRIAGPAVVHPAAAVDGVSVTAVAARSFDRARAAAKVWHVPHAFGSYAELVASDAVDAVYVGTPAALHRPWAVAAIEAGKHVLCEKPLAANAADAQLIADAAARRPDVVVMEAFHWRYHPCAAQVRAILDDGVLGRIERVEGVFEVPEGNIPRDDIRWSVALGGGATMDLGCYALQWVRFAVGSDPSVVRAEAVCPVAGVDGALAAELRWPGGVTGAIRCSMIAERSDVHLRVQGDRGVMTVENIAAPQRGAMITVETGTGTEVHAVDATPTYVFQLEAFRDAIVDAAPFPTTAADGVRTMHLVDRCYEAAGLQPRPTLP